MNKRIALHVLFWLTYLLWGGYILGSYDGNFTRSFLNDIAHLPLKITVTYIIMYYLLPNFVNKRKYVQLILFIVVLLILSAEPLWKSTTGGRTETRKGWNRTSVSESSDQSAFFIQYFKQYLCVDKNSVWSRTGCSYAIV